MKSYEFYVNSFNNAKEANRIFANAQKRLDDELRANAKFQIGDKLQISTPEGQERWQEYDQNGEVGIVRSIKVLLNGVAGVMGSAKPTAGDSLSVRYKLNKVTKSGAMHKTASLSWGSIREDFLVKVEE